MSLAGTNQGASASDAAERRRRLLHATGIGAALLIHASELLRRLLVRGLPTDTSAYVAAAQTFAAGHDPYGPEITNARSWQGYPFLYLPGTLYLLSPLRLVPRAALVTGDLLARLLLSAWSARRLRAETGLAQPWGMVWLLLSLSVPYLVDLMGGNLALIMLSALLATRRLCEAGPAAQLAGGLGVGVALSLKPAWGLPAGFFALVGHRWLLALGLAGGAGLVLGASAAGPLLVPWRRALAEAHAHFPAIDLTQISLTLFAVVAAGWLAVGAALVLRPRTNEAPARLGPPPWLWGCASLVLWPRLALYAYLGLTPLLAWIASAWGPGAGLLLAAPALLPLPSLLGEYASQGVLYGWALTVVAVYVALLLRSRRPKQLEDRG